MDTEHIENWTLKAAAEKAEHRFELDALDGGPELGSVQEAIWFHAMIAARSGEQIERATNALERIADVLEEWYKQGRLS